MAIRSITPPPGVWRNGTRYQAKGRYYDANLVRWHDGALRPIGGWSPYLDWTEAPLPPLLPDPTVESIRDGLAWRDNSNSAHFVWGTHQRLLHQLLSGVVTDITPDNLLPGLHVSDRNDGYGKGFYNFGAYGVPPRAPLSIVTKPAGRWIFDNWGQDLLAMADWEGTIYQYTINSGPATPVPNAPTNLNGFAVTNQRILMTIGTATEPRKVCWSDQEDLTNWDFSDPGNQAGFYTLPGTGRLTAIHRIQNSLLIFSETDVFIVQYVGPPFIYSFRRIAENCQPIHHKTIISTEQFVAWIGERSLWIFDGAAVRQLPCDVADFLYEDIKRDQLSTSFAWVSPDFDEIWWHYASRRDDVDSPTRYVIYDWAQQDWSIGALNRTTAISQGVRNDPMLVGHDSVIYDHEQRGVGFPDGAVPYATTGPIEVSEGDSNIAIRRVIMDTTRINAVNVSFTSRHYPTGPERSFGPYTYNNPIPVKVSGRHVEMTIESRSNGWEVGNVRADLVPFGRTAR